MSRILITGCSSGVGRETASVLASRGHEVIATARRPDTLADLAVAHRLALDVTDAASVRDLARAVGPIDALVNNAAVGAHGPVESVHPDAASTAWETNVAGVLRTVQAFVPAMRERGHGTIVNVSSAAGRFATPLAGVYCATKHAVEALTEAMRFELGHFGVRVVLIEPGAITTGMNLASVSAATVPAPYRALADQLWGVRGGPVAPSAAGTGHDGSGSSAHEVATVIADVLEDPDPPFRRAVGADAIGALRARATLDDADFDALLRSTLGVTW